MPTALILDPDIGFAFWLGRGLDQAGYETFPARSVADASALLNELRIGVDLLIVNPALPDTAAFIEAVRRFSQSVRVVAFRGESLGTDTRVDVSCRRPDRTDNVNRRQWVDRLDELLPVSLFPRPRPGAFFGSPQAGRPGFEAELLSEASVSESSAACMEWRQWEGRIIDGQYPLQRHLGGGARSAVFLTQYADRAAAIKVVLEDSENPEALLSRWERGAQVSHPNLIRLFQAGRSTSGDIRLLFVVMEYAEESLAEVLAERPLTEVEIRELLKPVVEALAHIHGMGLVHGRFKPSGVLVVDDQVKIASDCLQPAGERRDSLAEPSMYDPPESVCGLVSAAGDIWALGTTLVEGLTQRLPVQKGWIATKVTLPETLPDSFREIARQCLQVDPRRRVNIVDLASRLQGTESSRQTVNRVRPRREWVYAAAAVAAGLALSGALTEHLHRAVPTAAPAMGAMLPSEPGKAQSEPAATERRAVQQFLPNVPQTTLETIHGTLRVSVRVQVDSSGRVSSATLESPGVSPYFAKRALQAAKRWRFEPVATQKRDPLEEWILRFDYTRNGPQAHCQASRPHV